MKKFYIAPSVEVEDVVSTCILVESGDNPIGGDPIVQPGEIGSKEDDIFDFED